MWKLTSEDIDYLTSKKFSSGLKIKISQHEKTSQFRMELLEELVNKKKIIHLGCTDHLPLIREKIKKNAWLHKRLINSAKKCLGIDIDKQSIDFIKEELGYKDVILHDVNKDEIPTIIKNEKWDYMVIGEILEHVDNPVLFLSAIKNRYLDFVEKLIITVPNAFSYNNFKYSFKNMEFINSDHRYWFTPYTLLKVIFNSGMTVKELTLCQNHKFSRNHSKIHKYIIKRYPLFSDTIVVIAAL
jgi:hypothetical protein